MFDWIATSPWIAAAWAAIGTLGFAALCLAGSLLRKPVLPRRAVRRTVRPDDAGDQLEAIEGIGPRIAGHLRGSGIAGFAELARLTPAELRAILHGDSDLALAEPASWPLQAQLLARDDVESFLRLAVALAAGVPRLEDIDGVGERRGSLLRRGGIESVRDLAAADAGSVESLIGETPGPKADAAAMIAQAERFQIGDPDAFARLAGLPRLAALPLPTFGSGVEPASPEEPQTGWRRLGDRPLCSPIAAFATLALIGACDLAGCVRVTEPHCPPCTGEGCRPTPKPTDKTTYRTYLAKAQADRLFDSGKAELLPSGEASLDTLAVKLKAKRAEGTPGALFVVGHADRMRWPHPGGNWQLSYDRAKAVTAYLRQNLGWPGEIVFTAGRGDSEPTGTTVACRPGGTRTKYIDCLRNDRRVIVQAVYLDEVAE